MAAAVSCPLDYIIDPLGERGANRLFSGATDEDEPDDQYFPLTLRTKKTSDRPASPLDRISVNGGN